jgi:hypothetical protein
VFDARFDIPLKEQGIINAATVSDSLNVIDPKVVAPGDPARSMMIQRMRRSDNFKMPPLASNIHDESALAVLEQWISSLPSSRAGKPRGKGQQEGGRGVSPVFELKDRRDAGPTNP